MEILFAFSTNEEKIKSPNITFLLTPHLNLSSVDKVKDVLDVLQLDVRRHHDHGVLAGMLAEHHLEVGRGGAQDDLVSLDGMRGVLVNISQDQRHVGEGLREENLLEDGHHVGLVISPLEVEELVRV